MLRALLFLFIFGFSDFLLAADANCPDDWQKVLSNYVAKDRAVHSLTYKSKITVSEAFTSNKKPKYSANFSSDRIVDASGVKFPNFSSPPPQSYGSVETLPGHTKDLAKGLYQIDSDANDPVHWMSKEISTDNYSISCAAVDDKSAKRYPDKKIYKFMLNPLKGKTGLFSGALLTDQTGSPLEISGTPTQHVFGVKSLSFRQTYQKDDNGYSFPSKVKIKLNLGALAGGLNGTASAVISDISDVQGESSTESGGVTAIK